jgi:putative redox protein
MANKIDIVFDNQFHGIVSGKTGSVQTGPSEGAMQAYDLLLGGLGACLNHTFQTVMDKKKLSIQAIKYHIEGVKREEVPTTLNHVKVDVTVTGIEDGKEDKVTKAFELATKYCSVYETISKVAEMEWDIHFE